VNDWQRVKAIAAAAHGADLQLKAAQGRTARDLAKGVGVRGVKSAVADPHPDTVALLESLMAARGIARSSLQ
jgi:hypothetical protein